MSSKYYESREVMTECLCPLCECKHSVLLFWTGRGVPRIYCRNCREIINLGFNLNSDVDSEHFVNLPNFDIEYHFAFIENDLLLDDNYDDQS